MAQMPTDQNFFHSQSHPRQHQHDHHQREHQPSQGPTHTQPHHAPAVPPPPSHHPHLQVPAHFRNPFDLLFDDRVAGVNYNYIRPYVPNQSHKSEELNDSLVMRRPRRTRTTFTSAQIAELEQQFVHTKYLSTSRLAELSAKLALGTAQVKIWFKNRRRRHKIQTDQQKEFMSTSMNGDATMSISTSLQSMQDDSGGRTCSFIPPNIQTLNLGNCGGPTSIALTPSPTSSAVPASLMETCGDAFNSSSYYYSNNNHQYAMHPSRALVRAPPPLFSLRHISQTSHPRSQMLSQQHHYARPHPPSNISSASSSAVGATTHYFAQPTTCHQQQQQHQQHHHHHDHQPQPPMQDQTKSRYEEHRSYHDYQPYKSGLVSDTLISGFDDRSTIIKKEPDLNFNNPYYLRMPEPAVASIDNMPSTSERTSTLPTSLSPNPNADNYEPLTPQNDENPNLSNSNNSASSNSSRSSASSINSSSSIGMTADHMDDENSTKTLQALKPIRNNIAVTDSACSNGYSAIPNITSTLNTINMSDCTGAFSKYSKLTAINSDTHETTSNYQCTMDTLMHTYNSHTTTSSTQFAYCFN